MEYRAVKRPEIIEAINILSSADTNLPSDTVTWVTGTTHSVNENSAFSLSLSATSQLGGGVSYSKVGGADASLFSLNNGVLSMTAKDYEIPTDSNSDNVYQVTVRASSFFGLINGYADRTFSVTVSNVGVNWTVNSIDVGLVENDAATTFNISSYATSGTLPYTFSKLNWGDSAFFNVSSNGVINLVAALDFEAAADSNHDNIYTFKVRATDAQGEIQDITVNVTLSDVGVSWTAPSIDVGIYEADGATTFNAATYATGGSTPYTFTKLNGGDSSFFNVSSNGIISLVAPLDYEGANDADHNNVYTFQIRATDAQGETKDITVNITVSDVATPSWTESPINRNVSEVNSGYTLNLSSLVAGPGTKTYSLLNSGDYTKFSLTSGGTLSLVSALNYESPTDLNTDNIYTISARVTNITTNEYADVTVNITITDSPNPVWAVNPFNESVDENEFYSFDLSQYISSGTGTITYSKSGADASLFNLDVDTGELSLISHKSFEAPIDSGGNNIYTVNIRATDSVGEYSDTVFNLTINDVPEPTTFTIIGSDVSGSYNISHGRNTININDAIIFTDNNGEPRQKIIVYDDDGIATITLTADADITLGSTSGLNVSGNGTNSITMSGSVANLNAAFEGLSLTLNVTELVINSSITISISQYNIEYITWITQSAQSVEENASFTVTLSATGSEGGTPIFAIVGGADSSLFSLVGDELSMSAKNFEYTTDNDNNNIYTVIVQATTPSVNEPINYFGGISNRTFNVTVTDVIINWSNPSTTRPENTPISIELTSFISGGTAPYTVSIPSLYDYSGWIINTIDDVCYLEHDAFDWEAPTDSDHNNVYRVPVIAYDVNSEASSTYSIYITVTDVGPSWTGGTLGTTISENTALSFDITSHVGGGNPPYTYTLNSLYDYSGFSIADGVIEHDDSFNYESPTDANTDNIYRLNVTATDTDGEPKSKDIYITITNVDDIPDSITLSGIDITLGSPNVVRHFNTNPNVDDAIYFGINYNQRIIISGDGGTPNTILHMESDGAITLASVSGITFTVGGNGDSTITFNGSFANVNSALNGMYVDATTTYLNITLNTSEDSKEITIYRYSSLFELQKFVPTGGDLYIKLRNDSNYPPIQITENSSAATIQAALRANVTITQGEGTTHFYTPNIYEYQGWGSLVTVEGDWSTGFYIRPTNNPVYRANQPTLSVTNANVSVLNNGERAELIHVTGIDIDGQTGYIVHKNSTPRGNNLGESITFTYGGSWNQCIQISGDRNPATLKLTSSTDAHLMLSQTTGLTVTGPGGAPYVFVDGATEITMTGSIDNINAALNGMVLTDNTSPASITCVLNQGVTYQTQTVVVNIRYEDRTEKQHIVIAAGYGSDYLTYINSYEDLATALAENWIGPGLQPTDGSFAFVYNNSTITLPYYVSSGGAAQYLQDSMRANQTWRNDWGSALTVTGNYESGFIITASKNGNCNQIASYPSSAVYKGLESLPPIAVSQHEGYFSSGQTNNWSNMDAILGEPDGYLGTNASAFVDVTPNNGNQSFAKALEIKFSIADFPQYRATSRTKQIDGVRFYITCPLATNDPSAYNANTHVNCDILYSVFMNTYKTGFGANGLSNPTWDTLSDYSWETQAAGTSTTVWDINGTPASQGQMYESFLNEGYMIFYLRPKHSDYSATNAYIEAARLKINWSYPYTLKTFTIRQGSTP